MRARMAIDAAQLDLEYREINFSNKPPHMLAASPKGTVPTLILEDGAVIDESWDIIQWALKENDPENWYLHDSNQFKEAQHLIDMTDNNFKDALDRYKYADRHPEQPAETYRAQGEVFLQQLEERLNKTGHLMGDQQSMADIGVFPFIRQFAMVDINWFNQGPYPKLKIWLNNILESPRFKTIMEKRPLWEI